MDIDRALQSALNNYRTGDLQHAAEGYLEILRDHPDNTDALFMLGLMSAQTRNLDLAAEYFLETIKTASSHIGAYYNLGNVYRDKGRINDAFRCYQRVIQLNPMHAEAYINLGVIHRTQGRFHEEIQCYQKAIQINPSSAEAFFNLGHVFFDKGQFDKALACYEKVVLLQPSFVHAYMNLGLILRIRGRHEEALSCYQKAIQLNPDDAAAHWNLSNVLLLLGKYAEGWSEFEWFRKTEDCIKRQRNFTQPVWNGSDIQNRTILLHAEEGFGDTLQFIRYASLVADRGANVIIECQKELVSLVKNIEGIKDVVPDGGPLSAFDIHCPLMSLPGIFHTTLEDIPARMPYLTADPSSVEKWGRRLQHDGSPLKIGLIWSGGGLPLKKSASLDMFSPLGKLKDVTFYSLQKGPPAEQAKNSPEGMIFVDYTDELHDFSDTAAFIENLDLVISVDTAVAHLSGALGKPVWTLLPFVPDWRWLLDREDSPWYPSMKLFRQPSLEDWKSVIDKVLDNLRRLIRERR